MNNEKKIKKSILILTVIVVCIIAIIVIINLIRIRQEEQNLIKEAESFSDERIDYNNVKTQDVTGKIEYYTIKNCIQIYIDLLNMNNSAYFGRDNTKIIDDNTIKQNIYNLLSEKYIKENNITVDNVLKFTGQTNERLLFVPIKMNVLLGENTNKYLAYGFLIDKDYYKKKDIYIFVNQDEINQTFSIENINKQYSDINQIMIENENISITQKSNNIYSNPQIDERYIAQTYYNTFKQFMLADTKLAYEYLNEDYKNKRFGNYEEFEKYVKENRESIKNLGITKYQVIEEGIYSGYVCLDYRENQYIFKEKSTGQFEAILDTYTINSEKFLKEYKAGNASKKVQLNIDKFIKMINAKDYKNSYALLYHDFKNNYFKTEELYKQYIKNNLFEYNTVTYDDFSNEGETYIYKLTVSDKTGTVTSTKKLTIIMKLEEETDFVMSFSIE